jgi:hypothetical protein
MSMKSFSWVVKSCFSETVQCIGGMDLLDIQSQVLPPFSNLLLGLLFHLGNWQPHVPPKRRPVYKLHSVTAQKIVLVI